MDMLGLSKDGEELSHEPLLKQGMVLKCGRKVTSQWKKRYFVLRPTTLSYHTGVDTDQAERRYIEITQNTTVAHRPDKHALAFQVRTPGFRKITARCETEEEMNLWIEAIEECIRRAPAWPIKCVVVGDDEEHTSGKRVLVQRYLEACRSKMEDGEAKMTNSHGYTLNKSRTRIVKTPDELGNVDIMLEYEKGEWVKLMLWHLDGSEECTKLRALAYPHTDIYIIVFSVSDAKSFERIESYMKEIKAVSSKGSSGSQQPSPLHLLVGTRVSSELVAIGFNVAEEKARSLGFAGYIECRVDALEDCEQMFSDAVRLVVEKTEVVYAGDASSTSDSHARQPSGILSALAARLRKKNAQDEHGNPPSQSAISQTDGAGDSPDVSPSNGKRRGFFTSSSDRLVSAAMSPSRSISSKRSDPTSQSAESSTKSVVRSSAADGDEDSDEGSLIGVEVDETEEEAKARTERDWGLSSMKEDTQYTQKVLSRSNSRRSGEQGHQGLIGTPSHRSLGKELEDIEETAAEERERELEELRQRDAKRERELERMKLTMDNLKTHNKTVEEQLRAMREELAVLNKRGGNVVDLPPLKGPGQPPPLKLPPSTVPYSSDLPPRPPHALQAHNSGPSGSPAASKASFRSNRGMSVFF